MTSVDINCDMGESFGPWTIGRDAEVIRHITSANIACGFHAGDPAVMDRTVRMAAEGGVAVGAHPGYPDLLGFGRRDMDCSREDLRAYVIYQVGALRAFCDAHGIVLQHVKPHGSLYNMVVEDDDLARTIAGAIASVDPNLLLVTLAGPRAQRLKEIAREAGVRVFFEAFPDRAYTARGTLAPRSNPGAVIDDPNVVAERALMMAAEGRVIADDGTVITLDADTLCVHGDTPEAVDLASHIRRILEDNNIRVQPMAEIQKFRIAGGVEG